MAKTSSSNQTTITIRDIVTEVTSSIQGKLCQKSPIPSKCSIFRVPDRLRRHNEKAFEPELVSIGPFHHGKEKLQAMEKIKLWYLHCLLDRAPTTRTTLKCFVEAIGRIEQECRACYAEEILVPEKDFIEMLVVDGCFILELFRKYMGQVQPDIEDPVFCMTWMNWRLAVDVMLLENQLPWRVLDCLFYLTKSHAEETSLPNLVVSSYEILWPPRDNLKHDHILDCLRNSAIGTSTITPAPKTLPRSLITSMAQIPSVIELVQAGVKFKAGDRNNRLLDVAFKDGVMTIPPLRVWEDTRSTCRNFIAFEQCDPSKDFEITSYAKLLADLINNDQDADFLKDKGILNLYLGTEDVASIFKRLYSDASVGAFFYSELYREVNAYCRRPCNRWRATLKRDYFGNPWAIISLMAAFLILFFTFSQTLYSVISYYKRPS
ncbi:UPF0481 protein At3g47200-like [Alnus glutinosa]|uniref:UPF0481 protein At3g47200-like n=1 Tax=Alnus glutinosa TaxID=3517 RepID=UPI002D771650|nr:UPF0481 protein At3g47200-like [Alnus glutinosa]XP_062175664.1 UPF0481 protein At3g47200-like [Alnus glutinosa]